MKKPMAVTILSLAVAATIGCQPGPGETEESKEAFTQRMKEIEKRIKDSMPKTQEIALKQPAEPETVRDVQEKLRLLKEYHDEPSGKIDFVTVNAIQAFQRHVGLEEDGILDEETLKRLAEEAAPTR